MFRPLRHYPTRAGLLILMTAFMLAMGPLAAPGAGAQTPVPGQETIRTITVSGTGSVNVAPDTASVTLGVESEDASLKTAQDDATTRIGAVTDVLKAAGIAEKDIQTSSYNIFPIPRYDNDGNYRGVQGYQVSTGLTVIVRDTDILGSVLDEAVATGANAVWGISFFVDDPSGPASQARGIAVQDARAKADEYAAAAGVVVTGVVTIRETSAPAPKSEEYVMSAADAEMARGAAAPVPISVGSTEVRVDLEIVFEIAQANG
jgi:uncharacterized protein